jgi:hypothetical protein
LFSPSLLLKFKKYGQFYFQILIAYINPQPKQHKPGDNNDDHPNMIPIYDESERSSSADSEEAQVQSSSSCNSGKGKRRPPTKMLKVDQQQDVKDHQEAHLPLTEEFIDLIHEFSIFTTLNAYLINDSGLHQTGDKPGLGF